MFARYLYAELICVICQGFDIQRLENEPNDNVSDCPLHCIYWRGSWLRLVDENDVKRWGWEQCANRYALSAVPHISSLCSSCWRAYPSYFLGPLGLLWYTFKYFQSSVPVEGLAGSVTRLCRPTTSIQEALKDTGYSCGRDLAAHRTVWVGRDNLVTMVSTNTGMTSTMSWIGFTGCGTMCFICIPALRWCGIRIRP